jgi:hypothetical protein
MSHCHFVKQHAAAACQAAQTAEIVFDRIMAYLADVKKQDVAA